MDCRLAHAPSWEPRGRLWKYGSLSAVDSGPTVPSMMTWRCSAYQGKQEARLRHAREVAGLARCPVRVEREARRAGRLEQHHPRSRPLVSRDGGQHHRCRLGQPRPDHVAPSTRRTGPSAQPGALARPACPVARGQAGRPRARRRPDCPRGLRVVMGPRVVILSHCPRGRQATTLAVGWLRLR